MTGPQLAFAGFGLASQALLAAFFASHRRWPSGERALGRLAYAFAGLGLPLGLWLLLDGQSWRLVGGPLLMTAWALLGTAVDVWRPRRWRGPAVVWAILLPYLVLYFFAQMFMWWPLWDFAIGAWVAFLVLFTVSTGLNIGWHAEAASGS